MRPWSPKVAAQSQEDEKQQRLALARAIAHEPSILLLDEATSNLDVVTEQRVAQNLEQLPCTQIIIAHRLSTIRHADLDSGHGSGPSA